MHLPALTFCSPSRNDDLPGLRCLMESKRDHLTLDWWTLDDW